MADVSATRGPRSGAEWVTFACACVVLLVLVALILTQVRADDAPPRLSAAVAGPVTMDGTTFTVPVTVGNAGGATAAEVVVVAELEIDGETVTTEQTVDFLPPDGDEELVFLFEEDPGRGVLTVRVAGYAIP